MTIENNFVALSMTKYVTVKNFCNIWKAPCSWDMECFSIYISIALVGSWNRKGKSIHLFWAIQKCYPSLFNRIKCYCITGIIDLLTNNKMHNEQLASNSLWPREKSQSDPQLTIDDWHAQSDSKTYGNQQNTTCTPTNTIYIKLWYCNVYIQSKNYLFEKILRVKSVQIEQWK